MARFVKFLVSLPFVAAAAALALYALGGFVVAPWWIQRELPEILQRKFNATGSVGEVVINPFLFTIDARNFTLTEAGGRKPAITFDRLFVDFEASSLIHRAWTFAEIALERPRVNLEADENGALNLARLLPKETQPKPEKSEGLPRLLLEKFVLKDGGVAFTDKALAQPAAATLDPIAFELHDLSTLPDQRGNYTLTARLPAGGTLGWRGAISLAPIASAGQIEVKSVKLTTLWQFVQDKLRIEEPGGQAGLSLQYDARYADSKLAASASAITFNLADVSLRQRGVAETALTAGELALSGGTFDLAQRKIQFAQLALNKIAANTLIDAKGDNNWAQLVAAGGAKPTAEKPATEPAAAQAASVAPWQFAIDSVKAEDVRLRVIDQGFVQPLTVDIARAAASTSVKASVGAQVTANVENITVDVADIRISSAGAKESLVTLASANLAGGNFDLAQKKFFANAVKISKPATAMVRDASGTINLATAFARRPRPPEPDSISAEILAIEVVDGTASFRDLGANTPLALDVQSLRFAAKNFDSSGKNAMPFEAALQIKQGGTLRATGNVTPSQQRASIKLDANSIALLPLAALIEKQSGFKLTAGTAQVGGQLDWNGDGKAAGIRYNGNAALEDVRVAAAGATATNAPAPAPGASLRAQGTASTAEQRASFKVEARNVALLPLAGVVAKYTTLKLVSGAAHAAGQIEWSGQGKAPGVRYIRAAPGWMIFGWTRKVATSGW